MALPVGFYGSLQWIGWLSLLDEVALNHWNTHNRSWNRKIIVSEAEKEKYGLENEYTTSDEILRIFKESRSQKSN